MHDCHIELHPGQGPWLLMMHGLLSSRAQWRPNLPGLRSSVRPVMMEVLGHGRSEAPDDAAAYRVEAYIDRFEALRRRLGAARWLLCGQSFSAGLVIAYALAHPGRVAGIVLTNSNSAFAEPADPVRTAERAARIAAIASHGVAALDGLPIHPRHGRRLPAALKNELVADAALIAPAAVAHAMRTTAEHLPHGHRLAELRVPVLIVNGRFERRFQPHRQRAERLIPDCRVADLDGGHAVNIDAAPEFDALVADFARRTTADH